MSAAVGRPDVDLLIIGSGPRPPNRTAGRREEFVTTQRVVTALVFLAGAADRRGRAQEWGERGL